MIYDTEIHKGVTWYTVGTYSYRYHIILSTWYRYTGIELKHSYHRGEAIRGERSKYHISGYLVTSNIPGYMR